MSVHHGEAKIHNLKLTYATTSRFGLGGFNNVDKKGLFKVALYKCIVQYSYTSVSETDRLHITSVMPGW